MDNEDAPLQDPADKPGVIAFPPLILGAALGLAVLLEWLAPVDLMPEGYGPRARILGGAIVIGAIALGLTAIVAFRAAGTHVEPHKPTLVIVDTGPHRFTRNPMYIALMLTHLGVCLLAHLEWGLVTLIPLALTLHYGVVLREEAYLTAKFGAEYTSYLASTRRWT